MARGRSTDPSSGLFGLEPKLWQAADALRNNMVAGRVQATLAGRPPLPPMSDTPGGRLAGWSRLTWLAIAALGMVVVGLTAFAASGGVRGTDQFWYVADVETLVRDHANIGNTVFPVALLGPSPVMPPPFIHNILSMYVAAVPALVLGPFGGWLALNTVATLATASLIYLAARTVAAPWASLLCAVLYPLLPLTFWYSTQPLAEASTSLFAALAIYLLAVAGSKTVRWIALVAALGLLYLSRESYLPLLIAAPIGFLIAKLRGEHCGMREAFATTGLVGAVAVLFVVAGNVFFAADQVRFSYTRMLHTAVPGSTTNMWFNFDLSPANLADRLPFDLGLLATKLGGHLLEQFIIFESPIIALFYWTFNLLAFIAIVMFWRCRRRPPQFRVVVGALAFVAIHLLTLALFQNQARYLLPATPGLLVVLAIALSEIRSLARLLAPRPTAIIVGLTLVALLPIAGLAMSARSEGVTQGSAVRATKTLFDTNLRRGEPVMIVYAGTQLFAYAARPRLVIYVPEDYSAADIQRLRDALPARWLLSDEGSPLLRVLDLRSHPPAGEVAAFGTTWGLYQLP